MERVDGREVSLCWPSVAPNRRWGPPTTSSPQVVLDSVVLFLALLLQPEDPLLEPGDDLPAEGHHLSTVPTWLRLLGPLLREPMDAELLSIRVLAHPSLLP